MAEGQISRTSPGLWNPQRAMIPNFRSPSRDPLGGLPLAAVTACPRHSSRQQQRKSSTMDGDKKRLFLERMRASPVHQPVEPKTKAAVATAAPNYNSNTSSQIPPKGTSQGVEILTDDEIGLTCSNGLGPPAFFDLGGSTQMVHPVRSRHFPPHQQQQQGRYGFRSLSGDGRGKGGRPLFASDDLDDSPLLMSSIDGVSAHAGTTKGAFHLIKNDLIICLTVIL